MLPKGVSSPMVSMQQAAVGPQGPGDTLNLFIVPGERTEGSPCLTKDEHILPWFRLVG